MPQIRPKTPRRVTSLGNGAGCEGPCGSRGSRKSSAALSPRAVAAVASAIAKKAVAPSHPITAGEAWAPAAIAAPAPVRATARSASSVTL
jgi:hypothetical protein